MPLKKRTGENDRVSNMKKTLTLFIFIILAIFALYSSVINPYHNWDMIGYMAAAKSYEERDINSLHTFTYQMLEKSVTPAEYLALTRDDGYRTAISTDTSAFQEQLPFYQIRPLYTAMIYLLYKVGVNIALATYLISGIAAALGILLLYLIAKTCLSDLLSCILAGSLVLFKAFDLARYSTPDGLAFLGIILSVYLYVRKKGKALICLLPILLAIRTDLVLFTIPMLVVLYMHGITQKWETVISALFSIAVYWGIGAFTGNPGWATTFYFTMVEYLAHPISQPPTLTTGIYFHSLMKGLKHLIKNPRFMLYLATVFGSILLSVKFLRNKPVREILASPAAGLLLVSCFYIGSHFVIFPVSWDRFFTTTYITSGFACLWIINDFIKNSFSEKETKML
jgi:hypothetical protein